MASRISYKFIKHAPTEGENKLPPQAVTIMQTLESFGDKEVSRDELIAALADESNPTGNKLNARQPVERVIAFYQKRLVDNELVELIKAAAAVKEPKAPKAAKAAGKGKSKVPAEAPETTAEEAAENAEALSM
jgi:hypothetical protein